jgi:hypothetical protein
MDTTPAPPKRWKLDISELTLGDLEIIQSNDTPFKDRLDLLQTILVDYDIRRVRVVDMPSIMNQIEEEVDILANPTEPVTTGNGSEPG